MTDIASIKADGRKIEILHPGTGEKLGVRIPIVSIDDDRLAKRKRAITDRRLYLEQRGKTFKAEEIEQNRYDLLFDAMDEWEWYAQEEIRDPKDKTKIITAAVECPTFHGEVPAFSRNNVISVFKELSWFMEQVNEAVGETKAFF